MYGMVNRALEEMVLDRFGEDVWQEIKSRSGVQISAFQSLGVYDDSVTFGLVEAASAVLEQPAPELLRTFGRYWIDFALRSSYGALLRQSGSDLHELLPMLDQMHTRIGLSFPESHHPPSRF